MVMNKRNFLGTMAAAAAISTPAQADAAFTVVGVPFAAHLPVLYLSETDLWMNTNPDTQNPIYALVGTLGANTNVWDPETTTAPGS